MTSNNLIKDQTIHTLLARLQERFGQNAFEIVDHWDADLCAVGIARPDNHAVLAYLSTWKDRDSEFFVELELPPNPDDDVPYQVAGHYENIDFDQLARLVAEHLGLSSKAEK
jgi:hypothetical protein